LILSGLLPREDHPVSSRDAIPGFRNADPALLNEGLQARPDGVPAKACPLDEQRLAHRAIVPIEAVGQPKEPEVEHLLCGVQHREELVDHLVEEVEEQRLIEVLFQPKILRWRGNLRALDWSVGRREVDPLLR
jgi:hypothetical protein